MATRKNLITPATPSAVQDGEVIRTMRETELRGRIRTPAPAENLTAAQVAEAAKKEQDDQDRAESDGKKALLLEDKDAVAAPLAEGADAQGSAVAAPNGLAGVEADKPLVVPTEVSPAAAAASKESNFNPLYALPLLLLGAGGGGGGSGSGSPTPPPPPPPPPEPTVALAHDTGASASDGITSNAALTLSPEPANAIRTFIVDGGEASPTYIAPTRDGEHTVQVIDSDAAGNARSATLKFTLDGLAPGAVSVALTSDTGLAGDKITTQGALTLGGVESGATVQYSTDGGVSYTSAFTAVEGVNTVWVRQVDLAGNGSVARLLTFTLDTQAPSVLGVSLLSDSGIAGDRITNNGNLSVTGREAGANLQYSVDGGSTWTNSFAVVEGVNTVVVRQIDAAGNVGSASTPLTFTLDTTLITPTLAVTHDTGVSGSDRITSDASITPSPVPADATRTFTVDGGAASASYTAPTVDGSHTVVVTDTDSAGNVKTASLTFTLDTTLAAPMIALANDTGVSGSDRITSDASLTLSAVPSDATRSFTVDGGAASASYTAPSVDGSHTVVVTDTDTAGNVKTASLTFTLDTTLATPTIALTHDTGLSGTDRVTSDASLTLSAVPADGTRSFTVDGGPASVSYVAPAADGLHTVVITDTHSAGNIKTASLTFTLDTTLATPTVALTHDTGVSGSDLITSDSSLTLSAVPADATRTFTVDGGAASASYVSPTADGLHTVIVTDTDTAGNVKAASLTFTLDTTLATPTIALADDTGVSGSDRITSDASLTLSAVPADATRTFTVDGGAASASYTAPTVDGSHTVVVTDTDTAGDVKTASLTFTLDTTLATPTIALDNDTGASGSDRITSDASLTLSAVPVDATRTFTVDGGAAWTSHTAPTADGSHTVVITDTDTAGNIKTASLTFTLDTTLATPTIELANDTGVSGSDRITSDASLTLSAVPADATRAFKVDGAAASASYVAPSADGSHTVIVTDTDTAGNIKTASLTFTLDATLAKPIIALANDTGVIGSDRITSDASLTLSAVPADATRAFKVDGAAASASYVAPTADGLHTVIVTDTDTAGNIKTASLAFTLDTTLATPTVVLTHDTGVGASDLITSDASLKLSALPADATRTFTMDGGAASAGYVAPTVDGSHTVVVTDTDTADNVKIASLTFMLDTSLATPTIALANDTGASGSDLITSDASLTLSGVPVDATRTFTVDGGAPSASYRAPTVDGSHTVVVTDMDTAGNVKNVSLTFTLDTTLVTPTIALANDTGLSGSDRITSDASLTLSAVPSDATRGFTVDGGAASASYTAPTDDGSHTVVVTDTDIAGAVKTASLTFTLDTTLAAPTIALTNDTGLSGSDRITSDASLTLSAVPGDATRTFRVDGGAASASYTAPTVDGSHTVLITDTDTAGNIKTASLTFTLDTTLPTPALALANDTGASGSDRITSDASLTLSAVPTDATRTFTVDGGAASASYTAPTADGVHTVVVTDTDIAGNVKTASLTFTLDTTLATPTIALANDTGLSGTDRITSDASLTLSAVPAGATRSFTADGAAASASYVAPTADGSHTVVVTDTDTAGKVKTASLSFTLDTTLATPTIALANDTGVSGIDRITSDASLTLSAVPADATRTFTVDGGAASASYTAPTVDGSRSVVVTDTDTAGNVKTASLAFTLDTTLATPTVVLTHDTGVGASDLITSDASLKLSALPADATRTFTVDGGAASAGYVAPTVDGSHTVVVTDTDTADNVKAASLTFTLDTSLATPTIALANDTGASGSDRITSDASLTLSAVPADATRTFTVDGGAASASYTAPTVDASHKVVVTDMDAAGNVKTASLTFTLDTTLATPTIALANDTGVSGSDRITSDASLALSAVPVDATRTVTVDGAGASASYVAPTADGLHTVVVTDTDTAGNVRTASLTFTLDTTLARPTTALANDTGMSGSDRITSDASLTLSAVPSDATRTFKVDGAAASTSYTAPTVNGSHTVVVTDTDTAGNVKTASLTFTLDTTLAAPTIALANDTGLSGSDRITSDASLTLSAVPGDATRTFRVDGAAASASYVAPTADGSHTVVVTDTDTAGNVKTASLTFMLDTTLATPTIALANDTGVSGSGRITTDASVTLSAVPGDATRTFTVDGAGAFASYVAPTVDGSHTVVVTDTDTAGNVKTASLSFTLDTTLATPTIALGNDTGASGSDRITSDASLTLSAVPVDATRTFTVDGGAASASYTAPTVDGSHTVVVTDTDTAGNVKTASLTFTLDTTLATPTIALANDTGLSGSDRITSDASLTLSAVPSDATRSFTVDGGAASAGYVVPTADGLHTVVVTDTDIAGNVRTASLTFTLDTTLAASTIALANDTGVSGSDRITSDGSLTVSAVPEDATRTFKVDGGAASAIYTAPTVEGSHTVVVTDTDTAGNIKTVNLTFTLDTTLATPTIALANDMGVSGSDRITSDASLTLSAVPADATRTFTVDGGAASASYIAPTVDGSHTVVITDTDTAGNLKTASLTFTLDTALATPTIALANDTGVSAIDGITKDAALSVSALPSDATRTFTVDGGAASASYTASTADGSHTVVVTDTDTAGNVKTASLTFTLDTTLAAPTIALANDTGVSGTDRITSDASLTLSTVPLDATRTFTVDSAAASTSYTAPTAEGSHTVVVTDTDTGGNVKTASLTFTLDTTLATPPITLASDTGASSSDRITSDASLTLSAVPADATRTFTVDGGAASATYTAPTVDGSHTVVMTDTDTAGNVKTASLTFTLDMTLATPTIGLANDTGVSGSDRITSDASLALSTVPVDATRSFTVDGAAASATYTAPTVDGSHTVVVTDTDIAGNVKIASLTFALDTALATPTIALANDTGVGGTGRITSDASLTLTAVPSDAIRTFTVDGGAASATYVAPNEDGLHTVVVTDTDTAGNIKTATLTFTLDTTLATPTVALANDTGASGSDRITSDASLTLSAVPSDASRTFQVDGAVVSATYTAPTIDGAHTVVVTDTDTAGNVRAASLTFTLDTAPAAPGAPGLAATSDLGFSTSDGLTSDDTPTISVTATLHDGETLYLYQSAGAGPVANFTIPVGESGPYVLNDSYTPVASLADGSYTFSAQVVDAASNVSPVVAGTPVVIDTAISTTLASITSVSDDVLPQTGIVTDGGTTNDNTLQLDGSTDAPLVAGERVAVYDGGVFLGYAAAGTGATTWTYTTAALADEGTHSFTANVVRASGGLGDYSPTYFVVLDTTAPATPGAPVLAAAGDLGFSASDGLTSDDTPTIDVTATLNNGETLYLYQSGVAGPVASFTIPVGDSGPYLLNDSYTPVASLSDGSYTYSAQAVDAAGNTSALVASTPVVIDTAISTTLASIAGVTDNVLPQTGIVPDGGSSNDNTLQLVGATDAPLLTGERVAVYDSGAFLGYAAASTGDTAWSYTTPALTHQGTHTFTTNIVRDSGALGDYSDPYFVVLDTIAPANPAAPMLDAASDLGFSASDNLTSDDTPTINVTANLNDGETLHLYLAGVQVASFAVPVSESGPYLLYASYTPTTSLPDGSYTYSAQVVDAAGNTSALVAGTPVVIDTASSTTLASITEAIDDAGIFTGPVGYLTTELPPFAHQGVTNDTTLALSGTTDAPLVADERIAIYDEAAFMGYATPGAASTWSYTAALSGEGVHAFTALVMREGGAPGDISPTLQVVLNTTTPDVSLDFHSGLGGSVIDVSGLSIDRLVDAATGTPTLNAFALSGFNAASLTTNEVLAIRGSFTASLDSAAVVAADINSALAGTSGKFVNGANQVLLLQDLVSPDTSRVWRYQDGSGGEAADGLLQAGELSRVGDISFASGSALETLLAENFKLHP